MVLELKLFEINFTNYVYYEVLNYLYNLNSSILSCNREIFKRISYFLL